MHILSPETDNCPSWISGRERMTVENISCSISMKECCPPQRGLNPRPPGLQSDGASNWATEAGFCGEIRKIWEYSLLSGDMLLLTFVMPSLFLATVSDCNTHCSTRFLNVSTFIFFPDRSLEGNSVAVWKKLRSGHSRL